MDGNFRWELNLWRIQGQKNWNVILFLEIQVISSDSWNEQTNFIFVKFYWEYILFPKQRHTFVQSNDEKISIMLIKHRSSVLEFFFLVWNINKRSAVCLKATKLHQKINVLSANDVLDMRIVWILFIVWPKSSVHSVLNLRFVKTVLWQRIPHTKKKLCRRKSVKNE